MEELKIHVPSYFPEFQCKCGDCRVPCCSGWGIGISMKDYFRLLSIDCSPELREKLDGAIAVLADSTEGRYAKLEPDWTGHCKLQRKSDGYCMLQCECGEEAIPAVCRFYPRGFHNAFEATGAMANSCERTLELLAADPNPVTFVEVNRPEAMPEVHEEANEFAVEDRALRDTCIRLLEDRSRSLSERLIEVGKLVSREPSSPHDAVASREPSLPYDAVLSVIWILAKDSASLGDEVEEIRKRFHLNGPETDDVEKAAFIEKYTALCNEYEKRFPNWEICFEKMMVNHLWFEGFPYSDRHEDLFSEYLALAAVYGMVHFLNVCLLTEETENPAERFIDVNAAAFRLIEHSNFTWNAPLVLKECGIRDLDSAIAFVKTI